MDCSWVYLQLKTLRSPVFRDTTRLRPAIHIARQTTQTQTTHSTTMTFDWVEKPTHVLQCTILRMSQYTCASQWPSFLRKNERWLDFANCLPSHIAISWVNHAFKFSCHHAPVRFSSRADASHSGRDHIISLRSALLSTMHDRRSWPETRASPLSSSWSHAKFVTDDIRRPPWLPYCLWNMQTQCLKQHSLRDHKHAHSNSHAMCQQIRTLQLTIWL